MSEEAQRLRRGQRNRLLTAGLVVALGGTGAAYALTRPPRLQPRRVVIAVAVGDATEQNYSWDGDFAAQEVAESLAATLSEQGLVPVDFSDEKSRKILEAHSGDVVAAAAALGASTIVDAKVKLRDPEEHSPGQFNFLTDLEASVVDVAEGTRAELDVPIRSAPFHLWGESPTDALRLNTEFATNVLVPLVSHGLARNAPLSRFQSEPQDLDDKVVHAQLERLFGAADNYEYIHERIDAAIATFANDNKTVDGGRGVLVSEPLEEQYFLGAAAKGDMLMMTLKSTLWVKDAGYLGHHTSHETLSSAATTGGEITPIAIRHNFYSYPSVSADGTTIGVIVDSHATAKTLGTVSVADGTFNAIERSETAYFGSPRVSPNGARVAYIRRQSARGSGRVEVVRTDGRGRVVLLDRQENYTIPRWCDDDTLVAVIGEDRLATAVLLDASGGEPKHLAGPPILSVPEEVEGDDALMDEGMDEGLDALPQGFRSVACTADGSALILAEYDGEARYVTRISRDGGSYERVAELPAYTVHPAPTGSKVAVVTMSGSYRSDGDPSARDSEVVVVDLDTGAVRPVTVNAVEEEFAGWARDGSAVYIHIDGRHPEADRRVVNHVYRYTVDG